MFTVVIPLYNKEAFIEKAVNSVLKQTFKDFELIVVNDGSTDNSLDILQSLQDKRLKVISIPNQGVSVARNTGIRCARNDWICFLDADDWWECEFLETLNMTISLYPTNKIFGTGFSRIFPNESERYHHAILPAEGKCSIINYFEVIGSYYPPPINSSNIVIHKTLFELYGFFKPGQNNYEDHDLWLRLCVSERIVFCNKALSNYRKTEVNSASSAYYSANDFILYINTIKEVASKLNTSNKIYFRRYYNKFTLLVYIKNYSRYTNQQNLEVCRLLLSLLDGWSKFILRLLCWLPYKNVYVLLKKIKP